MIISKKKFENEILKAVEAERQRAWEAKQNDDFQREVYRRLCTLEAKVAKLDGTEKTLENVPCTPCM